MQVTSLVTELLDKGASVSFKQATDKVQEAIVLLKAQTSAEIELWAKLSRVAFARGLCSQALVCAAAALELLPNGCRLDAVNSLADMPGALTILNLKKNCSQNPFAVPKTKQAFVLLQRQLVLLFKKPATVCEASARMQASQHLIASGSQRQNSCMLE